MFQKVLRYTGRHRKTTYASILVLVAGVAMSVLPYFFLYRLLRPLLTGGSLTLEETLFNAGAMALCMVLYGFLYVEGLALSHRSAYHTLENLRLHLQSKLEKQPLGAIQEKGVGVWKKMFIDDIESMELLLAHALPEGLSNLAVPVVVFAAMFLTDWKLGLLSLCSLPLGVLAMGMMYRSGMSKMGDYYAAGQKMNNTIVEYINGMEVVKVFNRDGESYHRFETDVKNYRDFTLDWFRACWLWMALYTSILPCVALVLLPAGGYLVLTGASTLPDYALVLCMSFSVGPPLIRAMNFMSVLPQLSYKIDQMESLFNIPPLKEGKTDFNGNDLQIRFENVRFSYEKDEVLHGISFSVPQGSLTALVGESGSGKSTIAKLLTRLTDITEGTLKFEGKDITRLKQSQLKEVYGDIQMVFQNPVGSFDPRRTLGDGIGESLRNRGMKKADVEKRVAELLEQCGLEKEYAKRYPHEVSGGQCQRAAIARALAVEPKVLICDEATSALDVTIQKQIMELLEDLKEKKGLSFIFICHNLALVQMFCDRVLVLYEGKVVESGIPDDIINEPKEEYTRRLVDAVLS